jgi:hypothetical protein
MIAEKKEEPKSTSGGYPPKSLQHYIFALKIPKLSAQSHYHEAKNLPTIAAILRHNLLIKLLAKLMIRID